MDFLIRKRVERMLETTAVTVYIVQEGDTRPLILNIGPQLKPDMGLVLDAEGFSCTISVRMQPVAVRVKWEWVVRAEPLINLNPPGGSGGTVTLRNAV